MTSFRIITKTIALFGLTLLSVELAVADGPQAIATAAQHAGLAGNGADLMAVHRHLHHTLNCLVGADGDGFDAEAGNPCAAAGAAIPQTSDAERKMTLERIAAQVRTGIASADLDEARKAATDAQAMLNETD